MPKRFGALRRENPKSRLRKKWTKFTVGLVIGLFKTLTIYYMLHFHLGLGVKITCIIAVLSKRGRAATVAYIFVLAINGPAKNTVANIDVLGQALSCSQERLKEAIRDGLEAIKLPLIAMRKAIGEMLNEVDVAFGKIQRVLMEVLRLVKNILNGIAAGYRWLADVVSICNQKSGTPSERCTRALEEAVDDCRQKLSGMGAVCEVTQIAKVVCYSIKAVDLKCELIDFASDQIVDDISEKLHQFMLRIRTMFYVQVEFEHAFEYELNSSKTFSQITQEIKKDINSKSKGLFSLFNMFGILSSFCFICVIIRAVRYKMKYLTKDNYDNHYISREFKSIDERRRRMGLDTVLPLVRKERNRYIRLTSLTLIRKERFRIARSSLFLFVSSIQILALVGSDYCLFWLLDVIRDASMTEADVETPAMVTLEVSGSGIIADMYRSIVGAFEPMIKHTGILDPTRCAPNPSEPDFHRYLHISFLLLFSWVCIVLEPYGLRVRQLIMAEYYPGRARERATWLYNDILLKRETFSKIVRRQLSFATKKPELRNTTCLDRIRAKTNRWWLCRKLLGTGSSKRCTLCGLKLAEDEVIQCFRPGCQAAYCYECILESRFTCLICSEPIRLDDDSDDSFEEDSSDELLIV
ncbi:DC-STAMP domain-containing protein 2 isoform X2 [Uranotaenia lowii]|uniref:DC-STAMP domain-containing protein 2 isoform X2 n=1 Tax=Uranotaenia lowii TaxID=190385 RepID=UPI0024789EE0|nr:DC-STAMP domain-containing protein 2 isoform X2 [Uranotaenia lowii]